MIKDYKSRTSKVDEVIFNQLKAKLRNSDSTLRARAAYTIGEMGNPAYTQTLVASLEKEKETKVKKAMEFSIKRSERAIGPFWKTTSKSPYWLQ
jgi:HEAT repeat protein